MRSLRTGPGGNHVGAVPQGYRPPRDRPVKTVSVVACPTCSSPIGQKCVNARGEPTNPHDSRRRMALRKQREEQGG